MCFRFSTSALDACKSPHDSHVVLAWMTCAPQVRRGASDKTCFRRLVKNLNPGVGLRMAMRSVVVLVLQDVVTWGGLAFPQAVLEQ